MWVNDTILQFSFLSVFEIHKIDVCEYKSIWGMLHAQCMEVVLKDAHWDGSYTKLMIYIYTTADFNGKKSN